MFKIGFSKIDLESALTPKQEIREPIEAIGLYCSDGSCETLWITLDFMDFNLNYVSSIKKAIGLEIGLGDKDIHVLTTHNHGGGKAELSTLASLSAECARKAKSNAKVAKMRYSFTEAQEQLNIIRRLYIPEMQGVATLYFGACDKNNYNAALFKDRVIKELCEGRLCNNIGSHTDLPYERFAEADKEIFIMEFVSEDDEPIGSIVRFAAHAVTANRPGSYSSDYPFYVRAEVEKSLSGICMFLNGPCAEIAPCMLDKYEGRERLLGRSIANAALKAISDKPYEAIGNFKSDAFEIKLPVRKEVIENFAPIPNNMPDSLKERREYLEKKRLSDTLPFLREKYMEGESEVSNEITVSVGALSFNEITFVAFPGETFYKTGRSVKEYFEKNKIVTVTEHGRTVMYLPPKEDFSLGGYESTCKLTDVWSEKVLFESCIKALKGYF